MPIPAVAIHDAVHDVVVAPGVVGGGDGIRLVPVALVPEVRLYLAADTILLWARLEAQAGNRMPSPYWADAWLGGQAVTRYVMDHRDLVAGRRVLDVASGSGLAAIGAALAGAAEVTANDIDLYALAATELNARANGVAVAVRGDDLLSGDGGDADVILAGDVFYSAAMADRMMAFIERATARGATVLVGDPGRDHLPGHRFTELAGYPVTAAGAAPDDERTWVTVLEPT
jgi:predicted nicotinamide N-methyase